MPVVGAAVYYVFLEIFICVGGGDGHWGKSDILGPLLGQGTGEANGQTLEVVNAGNLLIGGAKRIDGAAVLSLKNWIKLSIPVNRIS